MHFPNLPVLNLESILPVISLDSKHKIRIIYDGLSSRVEFAAYQPKTINSLKVIEENTISYPFKFENRSEFQGLLEKREQADDILIVKNGFLTDSSYSNVAFWDGSEWFTPDTYLLNGVRRQFLLAKGLIREKKITMSDLPNFDKVSLMNAMLDLGAVDLPIDHIIF